MEVSRRNLFKGMTVSALMMSAPAFAQLEVPQKWDAEYDIVIVGVRVRPVYSAAAVAADEKLSAVLFEKQSFLGGSSVLNGGMFTVAGTKEQEKTRHKGFSGSVL